MDQRSSFTGSATADLQAASAHMLSPVRLNVERKQWVVSLTFCISFVAGISFQEAFLTHQKLFHARRGGFSLEQRNPLCVRHMQESHLFKLLTT